MASPYPITAIGRVDVDFPGHDAGGLRPLSRDLLALLIAAGDEGVDSHELSRVRSESQPLTSRALRNEVSRLREHIVDGGFPRASGGRYRLDLPPIDIDVWHLEQVATDQAGEELDATRFRHLVRPVEPYTGAASSPLIDRAIHRIRALQRELLVGAGGSLNLRADFLDELIEHVDEDPLNERLIYIASRQLARVGNRRDGLSLIGRAIREFNRIGLPISTDLAQLERELRDGTQNLSTANESTQPQHPMPTQLAARRSGRYVGQQTGLRQLTDQIDAATSGLTSVVVAGRSGVGKTRLCAEAAVHALERSWAVVYVAPTTMDDQVQFGPLVAAFPGLAAEIARIVANNGDADSTRVALWAAATRSVDAARGTSPLLLVIDDVQWIDDATAAWITHFATSSVDDPIVLVANGRADAGKSQRWDTIRARLTALGAPQIDVAQMSEHDIRALVHDHRPGLNGTVVASVGQAILQQSGGLPGIATPLIHAIDDVTTMLPTSNGIVGDRPLNAAVSGLDTSTLRVGVGAAVLGSIVTPNQLADITQRDLGDVLDSLDELVARHLIVDLGAQRYEVAHVLAESALLDASTTREVAEFHLRAVNKFPDDVHRRARHGARARPFVDDDEVVGWLKASARRHLNELSPRAAIAAFDEATAIQPDCLEPTDRGALSRALDLCAARESARTVRQVGFDEAAAGRDWAAALDIALSGLPEAELIEGDIDVARNLIRIEASELGRDDAFRHALASSRQLVIAGMSDHAEVHISRTVQLAESADDQLTSALVQRLSSSVVHRPAARLALMQAVEPHLGHAQDATAGDFLLNLALDHHESGDLRRSSETIDRLTALREPSVVKRWQAKMARAMLLTDAGEMTQANIKRIEAHEFAVQSGLGEADNGLLASLFIDLWLRQSTEGYMTEIDGGVLDPSVNQLTKAGAAIVCMDAGEINRAVGFATDVASDVLRSDVGLGHVALAMVAHALMHGDDRGLIADVNNALAEHGDSMIVIGAGAANIGPVSRYRVRLTADHDEKVELMTQAVDLAERSGSLLWRAVTHRSMGDLTGDRHWFEQVEKMVAGTELGDLGSLSPAV